MASYRFAVDEVIKRGDAIQFGWCQIQQFCNRAEALVRHPSLVTLYYLQRFGAKGLFAWIERDFFRDLTLNYPRQ